MASSEIIAKEASSYIVLNFYGKITRAPEKNNILVCEYFNMKFHIDGSSCFDYTSTDSFVTAWMDGANVEAKNPWYQIQAWWCFIVNSDNGVEGESGDVWFLMENFFEKEQGSNLQQW